MEFPFKREHLRLHMKPCFPENRERDAVSLGHASGIPASPSGKEVNDLLHRCSFIPPDAYVIG